jgi:hypothetical protein
MYRRIALTLLSTLLATAALAVDPRCSQNPWICFGSFEVRWNGKEGSEIIRMLRFANDEFMAEIEHKGTKKQYLEVHPSRLVLYSGLSVEESPGIGGKNPFMFFDYGFAYPAMSLQTAYPDGPQSVPNELVEKEIVVEKKHLKLQTSRSASNRIAFRLALRDGPIEEMEGIWDGEPRNPLPGNLDVSNWRNDSGTAFKNLQDARAQVKAPPGK